MSDLNLSTISSDHPIQPVRDLVDRVAGRSYFRIVGSAIGQGVAIGIGVVLLTMLVDYVAGLNYLARAVLVLSGLGSALWVIVRGLKQGERDSSMTGAALAIESVVSASGGRVISAIQLVDRPSPHESAGMVRRLVSEASEVASQVVPSQVVDTTIARRWLIGGSGLLATLLGLILLGGLDARLVFLRAMLIPGIDRPTATRVRLTTPDPLRVARGEDAVIELRVSGVIPPTGEVTFLDDRGESSTVALRPTTQDGAWSATLSRVMRPGRYQVSIGDAVVTPGRIDVVDRPAVQEVTFFRTLPEYTGLPRQQVEGAAVELLRGSMLDLDVIASRPLVQVGEASVRGTLEFLSDKGEVLEQHDLTTSPGEAALLRLARGKVDPPARATSMRVRLRDDQGLESVGEAQYPLRWLIDEPPVVERARPQRNMRLVTPWANVRSRFEAIDDWGLSKVDLNYVIERANRITMGPGNGLIARYYPNKTFAGEVVRRIEPLEGGFEISWQDGSPGPGIPVDNFSARFEGFIVIEETGSYQFRTDADDSARLFVNGQVLIDMPANNQNQSRHQEFRAGVYPIRVDYLEHGGWTNLRLAMRRHGDYVVVPGRALFQDQASVEAARPVLTQLLMNAAMPVHGSSGHVSEAQASKAWSSDRVLDLSALAVLPGDRVTVWVSATDGLGQTTRSRSLVLAVADESTVRQSLIEELGDYLEKVDTIQQRQGDLASRARSDLD